MTTLNSPSQDFLCDDPAPVQNFLCDDGTVARAHKPAPVAKQPAQTRPALYGDRRSGNCLKVSKLIDYLGLDVEWRDVDLFEGETGEAEFLGINPFGKLPALRLPSGHVVAESNAILLELARGTDLEPRSDAARAEIFQWLFWEASAFAPPLAQRRWCVSFVFKAEEDIDPRLLPKGKIALARLNDHLGNRAYVTGNRLSVADFALFGYGHAIEEGGWDRMEYPNLAAWIERVSGDIVGGVTRTSSLAAE